MSGAELASRFLLQLAVILLVCRAVSVVTSRIRQPYVIAEMVAGFLLGPSFFGWIAPSAQAWLFAAPTTPVLSVFSQLGVILYMFCVGLEFQVELIARFGRTAIGVSLAGIAVPLLLGGLLALRLLDKGGLFPPGVMPLHAVLFMGAAMSITAFPVLARIISERGIAGTKVGSLALAAGAVDDAAAWIIFAAVMSLFTGRATLVVAAATGAVGYVCLLLAVIRPALSRLAATVQPPRGVPAPVLITCLSLLAMAAWFTDAVGLHSVFGAFLLGAAMPRGPLSAGLRQQIEPITTSLLIPLFFAFAGLNTQLALLNSAALWGLVAVIFLTACIGKGIPCWAAARFSGCSAREAQAIATLMNARGMVELILLTVGLQRGLITPMLFTMMTLMAIGTTVMTGPLFSFVWSYRAVAASQVATAGD